MKIGTRLPILMAAAVLLAAASVPTRAQQQSDAAAIKIGAKAPSRNNLNKSDDFRTLRV